MRENAGVLYMGILGYVDMRETRTREVERFFFFSFNSAALASYTYERLTIKFYFPLKPEFALFVHS